jgi:hypothetical protein
LLPDDLAIFDDTRGMASLLQLLGPESPALRAARAILRTQERLLLCTGFPVNEGSETDGPAGAIVLGRALRELGRQFAIVSWAEALASWSTALGDLPSLAVARGVPLSPLDGVPVTIEVCGRVSGNAYLNMRGVDVRSKAPWFEDAIGSHALVSIGDGGNEFGMGSAPSTWFASRSVRPPLSTADVLVVGQVSNWAVLAIVAGIVQLTGKDLLPPPEQYQELLDQLAGNGVLDGIKRSAQPTEDGFDFGRGPSVITSLQRWLGVSAPFP